MIKSKYNQLTTLVLNNHWMPLHLCSAKHAFNQLVRNRVLCIGKDGAIFTGQDWLNISEKEFYFDDQPTLRSPSKEWAVPTIVVTKSNYFPKPKNGKISLKRYCEYYGFVCACCGETFKLSEFTIDHVIPQSKGGTDDSFNLIPLCKPCNSRKSNHMPFYTNDGVLISDKIRKIPIFLDISAKNMREEWKPFLFKH